MTSNSLSAIQTTTHLGVRVHVHAGGSEKRMHIAILIDTSGSMDGDRLTSVKKTLRASATLFKPADRITLVTFSDAATDILVDTHLDLAKVDAIQAARLNDLREMLKPNGSPR